MGNTFYFSWEPVFMENLQQKMSFFSVILSKFFTLLGSEFILVAVIGFLYWCCDKNIGISTCETIGLALNINPMIKNLCCRLRPYFVHEKIKCLALVDSSAPALDLAAQGYSFPSGHSTNSLAVYGIMALNAKKKIASIILYIICFFIGLSRIAVGCHYPSDILGGWLLTILLYIFISFLKKKLKSRKIFYLILAVLSSIGCFWCKTFDYYSGLGLLYGMLAGICYEEKYVHFENTKSFANSLLRLVMGLGLFLLISNLGKLPFSKEFLETPHFGAFLIKFLRYSISSFAVMGPYTLLFKKIDQKRKTYEKL